VRWSLAQIKGAYKSEGKIYIIIMLLRIHIFDIVQKVLDKDQEDTAKGWNSEHNFGSEIAF